MGVLNSVPSELYTLMGVILGGVGLKVIEHFLTKKDKERDDALSLVKEFRDELKNVREELWTTRKAYDLSRESYFTLYEQNATLRSQLALTDYKANLTKRVVEDVHPNSGLKEQTAGL